MSHASSAEHIESRAGTRQGDADALTRPRRVLLAGVGFVGAPLAKVLTSAGHTVFGLCRSGRTLPGIVSFAADVTSASTLSRSPADLDTIVYAVSPETRTPQAYTDCYVRGVSNLLDRYPDVPFILVSSTAVYDVDGGAIVDDETVPEPTTPTAQQVRCGELLLADRPQTSLVVRPSGIYGPGRTRLLSRLASEELTAEESKTWTNRIHRDDLVRILSRAISETWSGALIASDAEPATLGTIRTWVRDQLGTSLPIDVNTRRSGPRRRSRRLVASRLASIGYEYAYPCFRDGYRPLLAELVS